MKNDILHKENVNISQSTKQWVVSIVLLVDFTFFSLLFYSYKAGEIPTENFQQDDMVAISVVILIFSIIALAAVFSRGYSIIVEQDKIVLKYNGLSTVKLNKDMIKSFRKINKKDYLKLTSKERPTKKNSKRSRRKNDFLINYPNFVIILKTGKNIFIQTKKPASFEYSMNKMLNLRYG